MRKIFLTIVILFFIFFAFLVGLGIGVFSKGDDGFSGKDKVAVINIENVIFDSREYLESINSIKNNSNIKAIVLRINSPGGAVGPAQEIYSELLAIKKQKPVVASLGTVAASGGYYVACAADKILANPGTITGSIGVIAQFINYKELMSWAKVDVEVLKSGAFKDTGSPMRDLKPEERAYLQSLIDNVHSQFKKAVSDSRNIAPEKIDIIADGRIYTGEQAKDLSLIDDIGTLNDAIKLAGVMGGIEGEPGITNYPKKKTNLIELISNLDTKLISNLPLTSQFGLFYMVNTF